METRVRAIFETTPNGVHRVIKNAEARNVAVFYAARLLGRVFTIKKNGTSNWLTIFRRVDVVPAQFGL